MLNYSCGDLTALVAKEKFNEWETENGHTESMSFG